MEEYTQITLNQWMQWKEDIRRKLEETAGNFVYIGYRLKQIRDSGMFDGAADIFEFAQNEYGLGKSTVSRFIAINEKYSEGGNSLELKEEFKGYSSSKLAEMLTLPDSEVQLITERTTIKEIRELKEFNRQEVPEGQNEGREAVVAWTPQEKCLIDFFRTRKEVLNEVMKCMEAEIPEYQKAAELINPSGQSSHKKGIVFLFFYDYATGVKYKLLTEPVPVSLTWQQLLNQIFGIYASCDQTDVWEDFYGEEAEIKQEEKAEEKPLPYQSNKELEDSVATSQQERKEQEKISEKGNDEEPEKTQESDQKQEDEGRKTADEEQGCSSDSEPQEQQRQIDESREDEISRVKVESEPEEPQNGTEEPESEQKEPENGTNETEPQEEKEDLAAGIGKAPGKYEEKIRFLLDRTATKAKMISDELKDRKRMELEECLKIRAGIHSLSIDMEQLTKFIDLEQDEQEEE